MSSSLDIFMNQMQKSRERAPKKLGAMIDEIARKATEEMSKAAGKFLNEELDDNEHTDEQVKAIIDIFPESLSQVDGFGRLPIQNAVTDASKSVSFVPLMAREGCRLGVGGEGNRGGLFLSIEDDGYNINTIQRLANKYFKGPGSNEYDHKRAQVLEELRNLKMLMKDDIQEYCLVLCSLYPQCQRRFDFFASWNPECLRPGYLGMEARVPIHNALMYAYDNEKRFEMALRAGMQYFPESLGFLFCTRQNITAIKRAFDKLGVDTAMNIIRKCIPPSDNHLILHRALEHVPDLVDAIAQYYPNAVFLRDVNGHTLLQCKFYINLRRGKRTFKKQSTFFLEATDDQVNRVDPKTGLCPFMLAAVDNNSDLTAVYYLLSRNPKLVGSYEKTAANDSNGTGNSRKRQREYFLK